MKYTVKNLIDDLQYYIETGVISPDEPLSLQKDPEGNGYCNVRGVEPARRQPGHGGEMYIRQLTPELQKQGYDEEDLGPEDCENCVVIFP